MKSPPPKRLCEKSLPNSSCKIYNAFMTEIYRGFGEFDERTVLLLIISDLVEELHEEQRILTDTLIRNGRHGGQNPDYIKAEIDRTVYFRGRLEQVLWAYELFAEMQAPDTNPEIEL